MGLSLSRERAIPFAMRRDLVSRRIAYRGVGYWVIKDPVALGYHRLHPEQFRILQLLDGKTSLGKIHEVVNREYKARPLSLSETQNVVADFHARRLVSVNRPGQGEQLLMEAHRNRGRRILSTLMNLLYLRLPGWDPDRVLGALLPWCRWMFHPIAVVAAAGIVCASWVLLAVQFEEFRARLPAFSQFFTWQNIFYLWLTLGVIKVIHEFAHGLSCKYFGSECHQMGVMVLVFSPTLYCDVTDSWMLENKWPRIIIAAAGIYIELLLSAFALFGWWYTHPGFLNNILLNVAFTTSLTTVVFNANPLVRFDGYYMLCDLVEVPNLKQKADSVLRNWFGWYCLGIQPNHDPFLPETGQGWLILYSVAAWGYRWVILFSITFFLCAFLKPHNLQSIGIGLALVSILTVMGNMVYNAARLIREPRARPLSWVKIGSTLFVGILLLASVVFIPLPWYVEAAFLIQPEDVRHVYTPVPGTLADVRVSPGESVKRDAVLAVLENVEIEDRFRRLTWEHEKQQLEVSMQIALEDVASEQVARERLQTIEAQLEVFDQQRRQLQILAPADGVIVEATSLPRPLAEATAARLPRWSGTPLDAKNRGCFLEKGTHVLSIAPNLKLEAILFADQAYRNELKVGTKLKLKFEHLPHQVYSGRIRNISERHQLYVPRSLSSRFGGTLSTVTDKEGRERLMGATYQTSVLLDEDAGLLKPGLKGKARLLVTRLSAAGWIWRYLRSILHFRL